MKPLTRLRLQLTAWYAGTFCLILFVLGVLVFTVIAQRLAKELDESLVDATQAAEQATQIRETEAALGSTQLVDAFSELVIPERRLYLLDSTGTPIVPHEVPEPVLKAAAKAVESGSDDQRFKLDRGGPHQRLFQAHAERFQVRGGRHYIVVAVADRIELEDRYARLIAALAAGAVGAVLLVAVGGWFLAWKAIEPIERNLAYVRRFVADAAHELRTPVSVLRSRADVALSRERQPEAYVDALTSVGLEAERMGRIVDDLLTLARVDAGERAIVRKQIYLDDLALDAVSGVRVLAETHGVDLDVTEFEEAPVEADPILVRQLLVILLDNAVKFTPTGGSVSLSVRSVDGRAMVTVDDTGVGISPADLPRIYDRFYRGDDARRRSDGAGLGLSIAKWIADTHGADIELVSTVGQGTRVTVRFPPVPQAAAVV
ncbi:MAG TPA: HAMP domain-containing sensor histidine kinase [Gemmatimonadaceae bacterium]|nr:HAMP domain-containing sensor histidine kinase [Gemmatimonadaceae bacterium]